MTVRRKLFQIINCWDSDKQVLDNLEKLFNSEIKNMKLPDIEKVSDAVHQAWMESKKAQGVTTRKAEDGEELMVAYSELSEKAKDLDRGTVKAVYKAIEKAGQQ